MTAIVLTALVVPVAVGAVGIAGVRGEIYTPRDATAPPVSVEAAAIPAHDPTKPTAVVVLSAAGTNVADALPPYEVLAKVPEIHDRGEPSSAPIEEWLQRQLRVGDPLVVGVCVGAEVLAHPGLLDGRPATSHWLGLIGFRREYPAVHWQDGVRYVDDGEVITAAGVLSGVDAALRVVERMVGPAAAARAARAVEWPDYSPGGAAPIPRYRLAAPDVVGLPACQLPTGSSPCTSLSANSSSNPDDYVVRPADFGFSDLLDDGALLVPVQPNRLHHASRLDLRRPVGLSIVCALGQHD